MAGYDYSTLQNTVASFLPKASTDSDFVIMFPRAIDYAEQRIYRELDLLETVYRDSTFAFTANNRNVTLPATPALTTTGLFITVTGFNVITPASTQPDSGTRNQLVAVTRDYLDIAWPNSTGATVPQYYAPITQTTFVVGPWPDANYTLETIGTIRPAPLSATNTTTFLTVNLPDLFLCAIMEFVTGWQRDYGAQSDDPGMALSWSTEYSKLLASAQVEEFRKKNYGPAWTALSQSTLANPQRN